MLPGLASTLAYSRSRRDSAAGGRDSVCSRRPFFVHHVPDDHADGRYDGQYHEDMMHGRGVFTSAQGGWTYFGALEEKRPTEGEVVEADGRRFKVTHAQDCAFISNNPKPMSKVGVVCGAAAEELPAVRTLRVRQRACAVLGTA